MDEIAARVRAFVAGGALLDHQQILRDYFTQLSAEGWLIELSRAHLRVVRKSPFPHDEFAAWLGLRGDELGRAYRKLLRRNEPDREELVQVARRLMNVRLPEQFALMQKSAEMTRFRRARENVERLARIGIGRPTHEQDTSGPITREVERKRVELRVSVDDWSASLGLSRGTYLSRLQRETERGEMWRAKMIELEKDATTLHQRFATPTCARYPVVTREEMTIAYETVASDMETLKQDLQDEAGALFNVEKPDGFEPVDLYRFLRDPDEDDDRPEEHIL